MLEGIQIHDFNWRYTYVNNTLVKDSHYSREELIGYTLMDKYPGIEKSDLFKVLDRCMKERVSEQFETKFTFPNGTSADFELSIQPIPEGIFILSINISQRKLAEEKQKASEIYYHSVIEQANDMIYIIDASEKPKIIDINKVGCELLGYTKEELLKLTTFDIIFESDFVNSSEKIQELRVGKTLRKERRLKRKDGSGLEIEASAKKLDDGNIMVIARDISERKAAEEKLAANEKRFRALVENNYDMISLLDKNLKAVYRSPSASRIMGWTDEEYDKLDGTLNTHPDDRDYSLNSIRTALENPSQPIPVCFRRMHKDGYYLWLEGSITNLLNDPEINAFVTNFRDISERKKAEEEIWKLNQGLELKVEERTLELEKSITELKESDEKFQKAFQASTAGISITRISDSNFIDVNEAFTKITGYSKEELINHNSLDLKIIRDTQQREEIRSQVKQHGFAKDFEAMVYRKDGTIVNTLISIATITLKGEAFAVNIVYDITERKKTEKQLETVNKELEAFSYSVSHDLRAPLRAVNGYAQMLNEDYGPQFDEEGKRILQNIKYNAVKMGTLIDDLLAFSRLGRKEVQKREIDLNEMLEAIVIDLNKTTELQTTIQFKSLHKVKADYGLLYQAIFNLVSNGIKYSSKKEKPVVEITSKELNEEIIISIKDNGAGFDMKYADKLFGVFQRLHSQEEFEGTGVGLAIVQRVIAKHNGRVWAEAKLNQGATFYIALTNT